MGISCDAHITFGVLIDYETAENMPFYDEDSDDFMDDFKNWLCEKAGINKPDVELNEENEKIYDRYWSKQQQHLDSLPYEMDRFGYSNSDDIDYIIHLKKGSKISHLGDPRAFDPRELQIDMDELNELMFLLHDLDITDMPDWFLYSYYG